jgi:hypothetical protein
MTRSRTERLTPRRIHQIVRKAVEKRIVDDGAHHAKTVIDSPSAGDAAHRRGGRRRRRQAIAPLLNALDRVDRCQRVANASRVYDDKARKKLFDKFNRVVANLGADETRKAEAVGREAESPDSGQTRGSTDDKKKCLGGRRKLLKRLDSDKENKVNSFAFLCFSLLGLGWIWLDLAQFGSGLEFPWTDQRA